MRDGRAGGAHSAQLQPAHPLGQLAEAAAVRTSWPLYGSCLHATQRRRSCPSMANERVARSIWQPTNVISSLLFFLWQDETNTPIKQDTKKGKLRFYPYNINWCARSLAAMLCGWRCALCCRPCRCPCRRCPCRCCCCRRRCRCRPLLPRRPPALIPVCATVACAGTTACCPRLGRIRPTRTPSAMPR